MKKLLVSTLFLFAAAANLPASVIYDFAINTSTLSGQAGNLDFLLSPFSVPAPGVTAVVSGFSTDAVFNPGDISLTNATGSLASSVTLANASTFNDAFQPVTFGNFVDFEVTLSGPGIDTPDSDGTSFIFSLYDSTGSFGLLTDSPNNDLAGVTADSVNGIVPYTNPPVPGGVSAASVTPIPEPSTYLLVSLGLAAAFARRFRVGRSAKSL
jgi:PEP-CTERM motif